MMSWWRKYQNFTEVITSAPGPLPWYLPSADLRLPRIPGELKWTKIQDSNVALKTSQDSILAIFGMYCYVYALSNCRFIVWYEKKGYVKFHLIDTARLQRIDDTSGAIQRMKNEGEKVSIRNGVIASIDIPTNLNEGIHHCAFPDIFEEIDELLVIFQCGTLPDKTHLCLMLAYPKQDTVKVVPQNWFNKGDYDFGYQWPTRVARDPVSKKIFGEGMRLGYFILDRSNHNIEKWVELDQFHHPQAVEDA